MAEPDVPHVVEVIPCADVPYRCDGFDPGDWPPGEIPDFSLFREWEKRVQVPRAGADVMDRVLEGLRQR